MAHVFFYVLGVFSIIVMMVMFIVQKSNKDKPEDKDKSPKKEDIKEKPKKKLSDEIKPDRKSSEKIEKEVKQQQKKVKPSHPAFVKSFKGIKDKINDFDISIDGKILVAVSPDMLLRVFLSRTPEDAEPIYHYQKIEFDEPTAVAISGDGSSVVIGMGSVRRVEIYSLEVEKAVDDDVKPKIKLARVFKSDQFLLKTELNHLVMDVKGRYILLGSNENDTNLKLFSVGSHSDSLKVINTNQLNNHEIQKSNNGKFIGVAAWTSDVSLFEVKYDKSGFKDALKAITLKGHKQGVLHLAFNDSTTKVATYSKDGTIKLWNIDIRYEAGEDAKCLETVNYKESQDFKDVKEVTSMGLIEAKDHSLLLLSHVNTISVYDFAQKTFVDHIHVEEGYIKKMVIRKFGEVPYVYTGGSDARVHMWKINAGQNL